MLEFYLANNKTKSNIKNPNTIVFALLLLIILYMYQYLYRYCVNKHLLINI